MNQRNSHLNRVKLEREASEQARVSFVADVASAVFAATLTDEGPAVKSQPSKLWTSRGQYQLASAPCLEVSDTTSSIDAIINGVHRLSSNSPASIHTPSVDPTTQAPGQPNPPTYQQTKRERNHATRKAHRVLDALHKRVSTCLQQLMDQPSRDSLELIEDEVSRLRPALENVKRAVPSVEVKKSNIAALLLRLDSHIIEMRLVYPTQNDKPLEYNSGKHSLVIHVNVPNHLIRPPFQHVYLSLRSCCTIDDVYHSCLHRYHGCQSSHGRSHFEPLVYSCRMGLP